MKTLITKRLILRDLALRDVQDLFAYAKKPNIGPMAGWSPHKNIKETAKILKLLIREQEVWGITTKTDDALIGTIGLHVRNFENAVENRREIGYVLDDKYWGQGLIVEACFKVLDYGFNALGLDEIMCGHMVSNTQSKRVIEKCGFRYLKTEKREYMDKEDIDVMVYHMTKRDYKELIDHDNTKT
ncbi:GNAT family N-acetyltransferase [Mariniplasma anaerobium]|uniref:N-acetyltransferase n=1 Tax=Mariniplasma anaerobium TaxID=2735436 RepID=A0A7U9THZ3_9MOLU|nr:GNAT family protein [Mariniplasma anaerobium]BCR36059.1 N-acetyltransferase [Mariniplasma anaerobium]